MRFTYSDENCESATASPIKDKFPLNYCMPSDTTPGNSMKYDCAFERLMKIEFEGPGCQFNQMPGMVHNEECKFDVLKQTFTRDIIKEDDCEQYGMSLIFWLWMLFFFSGKQKKIQINWQSGINMKNGTCIKHKAMINWNDLV